MESEAAEIADPGVPEFEVKKTSFSEEATDPAPAEAMEETNGTNGGGHGDHDEDALVANSDEPGKNGSRWLEGTTSLGP